MHHTDVDRINKSESPLASGSTSLSTAYVLAFILFFTPYIIANEMQQSVKFLTELVSLTIFVCLCQSFICLIFLLFISSLLSKICLSFLPHSLTYTLTHSLSHLLSRSHAHATNIIEHCFVATLHTCFQKNYSF